MPQKRAHQVSWVRFWGTNIILILKLSLWLMFQGNEVKVGLHYYNDKIKEDWIDGACGTHGTEE
jgi:hypothetical protein